MIPESNIECCESFIENRELFFWFTYNEKLVNVNVMPYANQHGVRTRVNYCPFCGADIRDIKLSFKPENHD